MNANMNEMSESLKCLHEADHANDTASTSKTAKHGLSESDHNDSEDLLGGKSAEQAKNTTETAKIDHQVEDGLLDEIAQSLEEMETH